MKKFTLLLVIITFVGCGLSEKKNEMARVDSINQVRLQRQSDSIAQIDSIMQAKKMKKDSIQHADLEKMQPIKQQNVDPEIKLIGKWRDSQMPGTIRIYQKDGSYWFEESFTDGSQYLKQVRFSTSTGKKNFEIIGSKQNDHYVILPNGDLGMYDKDGLIGNASKVN